MSTATRTRGDVGVDQIQGVREAALRPVLETPRWFWPTVGLLAAVVAAGVGAWLVQIHLGLASAGYNDQAFWAIYEADLVTFIGVSYGGAVVSAILRLTHTPWRAPLTRIAEATALVTLPLGMMLVVPHLGRPWLIWEFLWPPYWNLSSPILWDFFAVSTYLITTAVFFYLPLIADLAIGAKILERRGTKRWLAVLWRFAAGRYDSGTRHRRILDGSINLVGIMVIPMAVSVHSVLSFAFASSSRPGYSETIFPVYFVVAALYSGVALVIVFTAAARRLFHLQGFITGDHIVRLGLVMLPLGATYLYLTFTEYLVDGYSNTLGSAAWVRQVIMGRYWPEFWFYVVGAGLFPILVMAYRRTRKASWILAASVVVLVAMWVKRLVIVIPAATEPLVNSPLSASGALSSAWGTYHFSWVSIVVTVAFAAAIPLLLLILFKFVPVLAIAEMEEMAASQDSHSAQPIPPPGRSVQVDSGSGLVQRGGAGDA